MTGEMINKYHEFFGDVWNLFYKYKTPMENDTYWKVFMQEAEQLMEKHGNTEFVRTIITQVVFEMERIWKIN